MIKTSEGSVEIILKRTPKVNYLMCVSNSDTTKWPLRYPVFRFEKGDVNNDGQEDLAVGVIKPTRNDSVARKRLFLFEIRDKTVIPMWLGSSLGHPLEDFKLYTRENKWTVGAIEKENNGLYLVAEYQWLGFGLSFTNYLERNISLEKAKSILISKN